jgi:hypothetical protein
VTGAEHYAEAERLLDLSGDGDLPRDRGAELVAAAQVHATLAFAAATVDIVFADSASPIVSAWAALLAPPKPRPATPLAGDTTGRTAT